MSTKINRLQTRAGATERQQEILQLAIELIADEGYAALSMRALARASGMKLGALQYHFRTSDDLLRGLVSYISQAYRLAFESLSTKSGSVTLNDMVTFVFDDKAGEALSGDRLWPQLWAMQQVEPLVSDLVEDVYSTYIATLEQALVDAGSSTPHIDALWVMSLLEGTTIFMGVGRRWQDDAVAVRERVLDIINDKYGKQS